MNDLSKRRRVALRDTGDHLPLAGMWLEPEPFGDRILWVPACAEHEDFDYPREAVARAAARLVEHLDAHARMVTDLAVKML